MHFLKILPDYFQAVIDKRKPFEIRENDRNFKVGDFVMLEEFIIDYNYTGRSCIVTIKDIFDISFLLPNYVAFTFDIISTRGV